MLLYGIMQVLSTLSGDIRGLKYTDGVGYFLCCGVGRVPGWVIGDGEMDGGGRLEERMGNY